MAKHFRNLTDMYEKFKNDAISSVNDIVPPIMKETMKEAIEIEVYAKYEPTQYQRRYEKGGLLDERNMKHDLIVTENSVKIILINYTKGDDRGVYPNTQPYEYIDSIIVTGEGYTWTDSGIAQSSMERDFYTKTEELLKTTNIINEIKKEMRRKGW